ncbi:MAG: phosphatidylserine decarboxylase [Nanoarchaeota archaeon]
MNLLTIVFVILACTILFLLYFYRDPKREAPQGNNVVSPADGRVISVIKTNKNEIKIKKGLLGKIKSLTKDIGNECYVISIFMSPMDVHYNRAPIEGVVKSVKHTKGRFYEAYNFEKSLENEKNEILIENKNFRVKVIQIAGFLARRIRCYVKKNQKVNKGEKIGIIALGSQTTLILSVGVNLKVMVNSRVKAGETEIAEIR